MSPPLLYHTKVVRWSGFLTVILEALVERGAIALVAIVAGSRGTSEKIRGAR
jgi:hypothetical protein